MPNVLFSSFGARLLLSVGLSVTCCIFVFNTASAVDFEEYPAAKDLVSEL